MNRHLLGTTGQQPRRFRQTMTTQEMCRVDAPPSRRGWRRVRTALAEGIALLAWMPARVDGTYYDFQLNDRV